MREPWTSDQRRIAVLLAVAGGLVLTVSVLANVDDDRRPAARHHIEALPTSGPIRGYAYLQDTQATLLLRRAYVGLIVLVNDGPDDAVLKAVRLSAFRGYPLPATRFYLGGLHPRGLGAEPVRGLAFRGVALTPAIGSHLGGTRTDPRHAGTLLVIRADRQRHRVAGWQSVTVVYQYHGGRYRTRYRTGIAMCSPGDRDRIC